MKAADLGGNQVCLHAYLAKRRLPRANREQPSVRPARLAKQRRLLMALLIAAGPAGVNPGQVGAQSEAKYPAKAIKVVVPLSAGGNMDALSRIIGEKLSASVGQPVIIENKPGATGAIGASAVAQAKPDGYTVLFAVSSVAQAVSLQKNPPYKLSELTPVTQLADLPIGLGVPVGLGVKTLADLVKLASEKPKALSYASYGTGSGGHIVGETLMRAANIELVHVPYKGEAPALTDLLGGHVSAAFVSVGGIGQHAGKIKLLAVTGSHRLTRFADAPTFDEAGFPLDGLTGWAGAFVPVATPSTIVDRLATEIDRIVRLPEVQTKILDFGFEPLGKVNVPFNAFVAAQAERWAAAARAAKIEPE